MSKHLKSPKSTLLSSPSRGPQGKRSQHLKLSRATSTKSERRIGEILKRNRIKFLTKWRIGRYEADFVIGRLIIEVDGQVHKKTNRQKDIFYISQGFVPIHISSKAQDVEDELLYLIKANNNV